MYLLSEYVYDYHEFCSPLLVSSDLDALKERAAKEQEEHYMDMAVAVLPSNKTVEMMQSREIHHLRIEEIEVL